MKGKLYMHVECSGWQYIYYIGGIKILISFSADVVKAAFIRSDAN
jgi:hypothetical protein